jgi:hypothetical protein
MTSGAAVDASLFASARSIAVAVFLVAMIALAGKAGAASRPKQQSRLPMEPAGWGCFGLVHCSDLLEERHQIEVVA